MKQIQAYETADGKVWVDQSAAEAHEAEQRIRDVLDFEDEIQGNHAGSRASSDEVVRWLREHAEEVRRYLDSVAPAEVPRRTQEGA